VGYRGTLGRVEGLDARTVRFTLCGPDGAFLARIAHPSLGIVAAAALDRIAADPSNAAFATGSGAWQVASRAGDNVRLVPAPGTQTSATTAVILRWNGGAAARTAFLLNAAVDGVDAPSAESLDDLSTMPEIALIPRPSLAVAYLGFGGGGAFAATAIRRAIAQGLDPTRLLAVFPPGSSTAAHLAPCAVVAGCVGTAFPGYNGPAGLAALDDAAFDRSKTYPLHIPDAPIPGLPDPAATGAAIAAQLAATLGIQVRVDPRPASALHAAIADGAIDGLYLDAVSSPVADAAAFYTALYVDRAGSAAARRASGIADQLAAAASLTGPADRTEALAAVANAARNSAGLVPLVSAGAMTAWRTDVAGAAASVFGADPLGAMTAGDRGQVVFLQSAPAAGGWCGASETADAWRLCALVSDGLYTLPPGAATPQPRLATACAPSEGATVWTCTLRAGLRTGDGETLDARDVVATFRAAWDTASPARAASGGTGETWQGLFGGSLNPQPSG
jgi:ABC-type transport system substrate-binding protein